MIQKEIHSGTFGFAAPVSMSGPSVTLTRPIAAASRSKYEQNWSMVFATVIDSGLTLWSTAGARDGCEEAQARFRLSVAPKVRGLLTPHVLRAPTHA